MAVELTMQVEVVVLVEHDGPDEGLGKVRADSLLVGGLKLADDGSPYSASSLRGKLSEGFRWKEADLGYVDDNTSFMATELIDATVLKVLEVVPRD